MKKITLLGFLLSLQVALAQNYTEFFTGNTTDVTTEHQFGVCMMGGATEQEDAMKWFLNKANGGDVVVLRASGDDGYNNYFYTDLGVTINSVTTFVINNEEGAIDPVVMERVANAEAIWFAGGDQYDYVRYFKDNAMEDTLNNFLNVKKGVIGGTSAGMAILGSSYFSAQYGTLTSEVALSNPYHPRVALGYNDFLEVPYLDNVITDTHYDARDRRGRQAVFMARFAKDNGTRSFGIACNEYTAVCVDADGKATVYGAYPEYQEFAYFLQANCVADYAPETLLAATPVTWNRNGEAIKAYKVPGTKTGENYFDLSDWQTGNGGAWENWSINNGLFTTAEGTNPECGQLSIPAHDFAEITVYPNPFTDGFTITNPEAVRSIQLYDLLGKQITIKSNPAMNISTSALPPGIYILKLQTETAEKSFKLVKR